MVPGPLVGERTAPAKPQLMSDNPKTAAANMPCLVCLTYSSDGFGAATLCRYRTEYTQIRHAGARHAADYPSAIELPARIGARAGAGGEELVPLQLFPATERAILPCEEGSRRPV